METATGRYVVFLGDDTVPRGSFLAQHWDSQQQGGRERVVIGYTPWSSTQPKTAFLHHIGELGWQFGFSLIEDPFDLPFNFFYTSNLSISRDFFLEAGGFDESFQEYGWEDMELGWRLQKMGMQLVYNRDAVASHHHPTNFASFVRRQRKVGYSAWTFYKRHPELEDFLNVCKAPRYSTLQIAQMWLLTQACRLTERTGWPDLSSYYPDLLSYHYNRGIQEGHHDAFS